MKCWEVCEGSLDILCKLGLVRVTKEADDKLPFLGGLLDTPLERVIKVKINGENKDNEVGLVGK